MPRPRALLLTPDYPPMGGGVQLVMRRLVEQVQEIDVSVMTIGVPGATGFDRERPEHVVRVGRRGMRNRRAVTMLNLRGLAEGLRHPPDLLVCGFSVAAPATIALRRALRRPSLQYLHAEEMLSRPVVTGHAVRRADAVVAVSAYSASLALGAGARPERVHRVHPGVDASATGPVAKASRPTIVTVARLVDPSKGHGVVLRALPGILRRVPDAEWAVIGDGPLRRALERDARELGVAGSVRFLGSVSDRERDEWLGRSHVFTLPNWAGEGFGIVFLEAAMQGLPVVAGAVGGALDAVANGETGLLVDPRDPDAVGGAIADLLTDPDRASALGAAGAVRARTFTWARHVAAVEAVLLELHRARIA